MKKAMRPKIALFNAAAPLANKIPGPRRSAQPQWPSARGKSSQRKGLRPRNPAPQIEPALTPARPDASREAALDLTYVLRHQISAG
jgi:hypothetical protein